MQTKVLLAVLALTQSAWAVITDFPYAESFEHGGAIPSGWVSEAYLHREAKQGESWVQVGTVKRWTPYSWIESLDSLAAHQSTNTLLRFRVRTDSTATAEDVCIDDLRIFDNTNAPASPALQAPAHGASGAPVFATLRWEPCAGLTGYRLYVGTDGGGQQVGPDFFPDSTNANWTRASLPPWWRMS